MAAMKNSDFTVFGIRHHGPGSAFNLLQALERMKPDCILVEGPPDANALIEHIRAKEMNPPVALLVYGKQNPGQAVFYPFAEFSPEWQALRFAVANNIPARFMDLPQANQMAVEQERWKEMEGQGGQEQGALPESDETPDQDDENDSPSMPDMPDPADPLDWFAKQAGYEDGEAWWEHAVEERLDSGDLFLAISDAMSGLREQFPRRRDRAEELREQRREAFMRKAIRLAAKEGFENIAVVCGAWHAPALVADVKVKDDNLLLRNLPKIAVEATWVPWTYGRLSRKSGYGAGIESPGWYHHLWQYRRSEHDAIAPDSPELGRPDAAPASGMIAIRWFVSVARLLREEDLDASSAHIIEAVRMADALAAMRNRPFAGLEELEDATQAVLCFGDRAPLSLIRERLLVGDRMGKIPENTPKVPIQIDLEKQQRSLRLKPKASPEQLDLDLRVPNGLARSHLLHRLNLIGIPWGKTVGSGSGKKGTFHELWNIQWDPEFAVALIEASMWGATVEASASAKAVRGAKEIGSVAQLADLVHAVILSELPDAIGPVIDCLQSRCAETNDVSNLMRALPSLANVLRYGNVRQSDSSMVAKVIDGLVARICIGLVPACQSLDEEAAEAMNEKVIAVHHAMFLLENEDHQKEWVVTLQSIWRSEPINPLVRGKACRLLFDRNELDSEQVAHGMAFAVSPGNDPAEAAAWIQGFLEGSGMILLHDTKLWDVLDSWVCDLPAERFTELLPLVRRTFSTFSAPEREQIGKRVRAGQKASSKIESRFVARNDEFNTEWGDRAMLTVEKLLGIGEKSQ